MKPLIIVFDTDKASTNLCKNILRKNYFVLTTESYLSFVFLLKNNNISAVVLGENLPCDQSGKELVQKIREFYKPTDLGVVLMTTVDSEEKDLISIKKPFQPTQLLSRVEFARTNVRKSLNKRAIFAPKYLAELDNENIDFSKLFSSTLFQEPITGDPMPDFCLSGEVESLVNKNVRVAVGKKKTPTKKENRKETVVKDVEEPKIDQTNVIGRLGGPMVTPAPKNSFAIPEDDLVEEETVIKEGNDKEEPENPDDDLDDSEGDVWGGAEGVDDVNIEEEPILELDINNKLDLEPREDVEQTSQELVLDLDTPTLKTPMLDAEEPKLQMVEEVRKSGPELQLIEEVEEIEPELPAIEEVKEVKTPEIEPVRPVPNEEGPLLNLAELAEDDEFLDEIKSIEKELVLKEEREGLKSEVKPHREPRSIQDLISPPAGKDRFYKHHADIKESKEKSLAEKWGWSSSLDGESPIITINEDKEERPEKKSGLLSKFFRKK